VSLVHLASLALAAKVAPDLRAQELTGSNGSADPRVRI